MKKYLLIGITIAFIVSQIPCFADENAEPNINDYGEEYLMEEGYPSDQPQPDPYLYLKESLETLDEEIVEDFEEVYEDYTHEDDTYTVEETRLFEDTYSKTDDGGIWTGTVDGWYACDVTYTTDSDGNTTETVVQKRLQYEFIVATLSGSGTDENGYSYTMSGYFNVDIFYNYNENGSISSLSVFGNKDVIKDTTYAAPPTTSTGVLLYEARDANRYRPYDGVFSISWELEREETYERIVENTLVDGINLKSDSSTTTLSTHDLDGIYRDENPATPIDWTPREDRETVESKIWQNDVLTDYSKQDNYKSYDAWNCGAGEEHKNRTESSDSFTRDYVANTFTTNQTETYYDGRVAWGNPTPTSEKSYTNFVKHGLAGSQRGAIEWNSTLKISSALSGDTEWDIDIRRRWHTGNQRLMYYYDFTKVYGSGPQYTQGWTTGWDDWAHLSTGERDMYDELRNVIAGSFIYMYGGASRSEFMIN